MQNKQRYVNCVIQRLDQNTDLYDFEYILEPVLFKIKLNCS